MKPELIGSSRDLPFSRGPKTCNFLLLLFLLSLVSAPGMVWSAVRGHCSSCHTMHHSQDGRALSQWGEDGPYQALLTTDCAGCHMGVNSGGETPFVISATEPSYQMTGTEAGTNTLAGGNFFWVASTGMDSRGHNVEGLTAPDSSLPSPPGFDGSQAAADGSIPAGGSWPNGRQVGCAGTYGCHGTHNETHPVAAVKGGHHQGRGGAITSPGSEPAGGYRMLVGIAGYEDPQWEFNVNASSHNQYKGADGTRDDSTISSLCIRCHGKFHDQGSIGRWIRHPVDYDMANSAADSEVRGYGGDTNQYQPAVPVASFDVSRPLNQVNMQGGEAIVTCLSCHRAHGSPYDKMMRFNYAGSLGDGCIVCHTSKD